MALPAHPNDPSTLPTYLLQGAASQRGYDCAWASAASAYDLFLGSPADNASAALYTRQAGNADVRYGWQLAPCDTPSGYICEVGGPPCAAVSRASWRCCCSAQCRMLVPGWRSR